MAEDQAEWSWEKVKLYANMAFTYTMGMIHLFLLTTVTLVPNCMLNILKPLLRRNDITIIGSGRNSTDCTVKFMYYYSISPAKNFLKMHLQTSRYAVVYTPTLVQYVDLNLWEETIVTLSPELADDVEMKQPVKDEVDLGTDEDLLAELANMEHEESVVNNDSIVNEEDKKDI